MNNSVTDLSITQKALIYMIPERGAMEFYNASNYGVGFFSCAICELMCSGHIDFKEDKTLTICKPLDEEKYYLKKIYLFIEENKEVKLGKILEKYFLGSSAPIKELFSAVADSLVEKDILTVEETKIIFSTKNLYKVKKEYKDILVEDIKKKVLEYTSGSISEEDQILIIMINKVDILRKYFSKYESKLFRENIEKIKKLDDSKLMKNIQKYMDDLTMILILIASII